MPGRKRSGVRAGNAAAPENLPPGTPASYDEWTVADLRRRAEQLGLTGYSGKKKAALVAMLRDH